MDVPRHLSNLPAQPVAKVQGLNYKVAAISRKVAHTSRTSDCMALKAPFIIV